MEKILAQFEEYKTTWQVNKPNLERCQALMTQLKVNVALLPMPTPQAAIDAFERSKTVSRELYLSRELLEHAVLLAVQLRDEAAFERTMVQLKGVYGDFGRALPESARQGVLLGLWLLFLLAENRIGDFHAELEQLSRLLPGGAASNRYVTYVVGLEQAKMEGRYTKLWAAPSLVPSESYVPFTEKLIETAREDIADAMEAAYAQLQAEEARRLLGLPHASDLQRFVSARQWRTQGSLIRFGRDEPQTVLDAQLLISESLRYADELERII